MDKTELTTWPSSKAQFYYDFDKDKNLFTLQDMTYQYVCVDIDELKNLLEEIKSQNE